MGVSAGMRSTGNGRPNYIYNTENKSALFFRFLYGYQCICSFATLRNGNNYISFINDRISVTEFRSIFYFNGDPAKLFNNIFCHQTRVPTGATCNNNVTWSIY